MTRVILLSPLLLLVGCVARPAGDDAGTTTMAGESSETAEPGTSSESESTTGGVTTEDGDGDPGDGDPGDGDPGDGDDDCYEPRKLDLPPDSEAPMPDSCTVELIPWPTPEQWPGCVICEIGLSCAHDAYLGCVTPLAGETCADICPGGDCLSVYWESCEGDELTGWGSVPVETCGLYEIDGKCCTIGKFVEYCAE